MGCFLLFLFNSMRQESRAKASVLCVLKLFVYYGYNKIVAAVRDRKCGLNAAACLHTSMTSQTVSRVATLNTYLHTCLTLI